MINATLCRTSLIHIVGSVVLCQLWISLSCAWPPIRLHGDALDSRWLFDRVPVVVMAAAHVCLGCCLSSWNMCPRHVRAHLGLIFVGDCQQQGEWKGDRGVRLQSRERGILSQAPRSVRRASTRLKCFRLRPIVATARKERAGPRRWQRHRHWPPCENP